MKAGELRALTLKALACSEVVFTTPDGTILSVRGFSVSHPTEAATKEKPAKLAGKPTLTIILK
jgi:hypothetical protein